MSRLKLLCAAKINLSLDVTGKLPNGYHTLDSIFQSVSVYDTLTLTVTDGEGIELACETPGVPCDESNLAWKAAQAYLDAANLQKHVAITLEKGIPSGAGMGGGSADAAGVLWGLNELLSGGFSNEALRRIGVKLGADVPFILLGGTALARGIGEDLKSLSPLPESFKFVIVKGEESVSTPAAYKAIDTLGEDTPHPDTAGVLWAVETKDEERLAEKCANLFEYAVPCEDVQRAEERLQAMGALAAVMTGSGAAVFGIFPMKTPGEQLEGIADTLRQEFTFAQAAHPVESAFVILEREN